MDPEIHLILKNLEKAGYTILKTYSKEPGNSLVLLAISYHNKILVIKAASNNTRKSRLRKEHYLLSKAYNAGAKVVKPGRYFETQDSAWFEMEPADTDASRLSNKLRNFMWWGAAARIAQSSCGALRSLHTMGIIHHDVKPSNILVNIPVDSCWNLEYCDHGDSTDEILAKEYSVGKHGVAPVCAFSDMELSIDKAGAEAGILNGTLCYLPPEALAGREYTMESDVFSLGLSIIEIITGSLYTGYSECLRSIQCCQDVPGEAIELIFKKSQPDHIKSALVAHAILCDMGEQIPGKKSRVARGVQLAVGRLDKIAPGESWEKLRMIHREFFRGKLIEYLCPERDTSKASEAHISKCESCANIILAMLSSDPSERPALLSVENSLYSLLN